MAEVLERWAASSSPSGTWYIVLTSRALSPAMANFGSVRLISRACTATGGICTAKPVGDVEIGVLGVDFASSGLSSVWLTISFNFDGLLIARRL